MIRQLPYEVDAVENLIFNLVLTTGVGFYFQDLWVGVEGGEWFPPKGETATAPPWGGWRRWVFVFRGWGRHLGPQLITYSLSLSGTCAELVVVDGG